MSEPEDRPGRVVQLLRLLQFGDSMLPVGAFAFSNGLEAAVQQRIVRDVQTLRQFVETATRQAAMGDGVAVLQTHRAARAADRDALARADRAVYHRKLNEEMRAMTVRMGRKLGELADHVLGAPLLSGWVADVRRGATPGTYPVGLGLVTAELGLAGREAFALHQYGVAAMMLGAALRLMRISYLETQAILFEVGGRAEADHERAAAATLDDMAGFAPVTDILAASHVRSHVRLFMN